MPMPETVHDMLRAGYQRLNDGTCKGCNAPIAWFKTTRGARLPVNLPIPNDFTPVDPHWATCPNTNDFKGPKRRAEQTAGERRQAVEALLNSSGARVIIALYPEGCITALTNGLAPEETRDELITAANQVRWKLQIAPKGASS